MRNVNGAPRFAFPRSGLSGGLVAPLAENAPTSLDNERPSSASGADIRQQLNELLRQAKHDGGARDSPQWPRPPPRRRLATISSIDARADRRSRSAAARRYIRR
ncbi:hypothetical protein J4763_22905 [Burkholderia pseudomallei]|uniref:hypothetical protein n=1 Tax=Burkholderia pseudomallei TaxID=28450 RepID=UPI001AA004C9|nr:hypothetical protein [Burkholderia pseudomallei]MBO3059621.1 hypothetical protein [Burkholderia pseudomallei]QTB45896.1 hypothetical protein J3B47_30280 [Burkholderia pseudomallei]